MADKNRPTRREMAEAIEDAETPEVAMNATADFILAVLAEALGVTSYEPGDGTETWDGDVACTVYNILRAARVMDDEGEVARHAA